MQRLAMIEEMAEKAEALVKTAAKEDAVELAEEVAAECRDSWYNDYFGIIVTQEQSPAKLEPSEDQTRAEAKALYLSRRAEAVAKTGKPYYYQRQLEEEYRP